MLVLIVLLACQPAMAADEPSVQSAEIMYMLNCQGCHRADGGGTGSAVPSLAGLVARFLSVPAGREYLIRVPGVEASPLSDHSLAIVVNWMLQTFDREHVPADFIPYTAQEIGSFRKMGPYGTEASSVRLALLKSFPPAASVNR